MIRKPADRQPTDPPRDHGLELLLTYDGRVEYLPSGYSLKFVSRGDAPTVERPHGLRCSFTLHDPSHRRILGFDNAHGVKPLGRGKRRSSTHDHWHRDAADKGRPYALIDAATLLRDFYTVAERLLRSRGIVLDVIGESSHEATQMSKAIPRVQSFASLRDEMVAVARGARVAPAHAALPSVHSADLIARLLTPENRSLLSVLRSQQPESVAQLAAFTQRAPSNLTRTLEKLASAGLVSFELAGRRKVPRVIADRITIEIDPFSLADVIRVHAVSERGASAPRTSSSKVVRLAKKPSRVAAVARKQAAKSGRGTRKPDRSAT